MRALEGRQGAGGFAGSVADALTLYEKFEEKLDRYPANLPRAAVELAKDWRSDRILRRLEALLVVVDLEHGFLLSGTGELSSPTTASSPSAREGTSRWPPPGRCCRAGLSAREIVQRSLEIAAISACSRTEYHDPEPRRLTVSVVDGDAMLRRQPRHFGTI